ncbi:hypothetical protein JOF53_002891 [Crossiella equi]|uniref:DUF2637 domain-containing protein n=1 Tax=Crossiella equi TaxID=130796 RepID=A0ABS5ABQ0_9PSEU|nr:hypothetical protein [Crossiella equi]MBP2474019.1 hypothetical protein [Crossiella equi]
MSRNDKTSPLVDAEGSPGETRRVRKLRDQLAESGQLHALTSDPHLNAVRIERLRASVTGGMWFFLGVGLAFTTTGVHSFLAGHLTAADPLWWGAWLAEPALAGILITLLRWESEMLSRGVSVADKPVRRLKSLLLLSTLVMNVWSAVFPATGTVSGGNLVLHVVIPAVVYLVAEVMPVIQRSCTQAKERATADALAAAPPAPTPAEPAAVTAAPAPQPPQVSTPPAAPPATPTPPPASAMRLPGHMATALDQLREQARRDNRPLAAAEIQQALRVAPDFAARLATEYTPPATNGHSLTV